MKKARLHNRVNREVLIKQMLESPEPRTTISFYKYHRIENPKEFRDELFLLLDSIETKGRIYLATEGVNGQISVPSKNVELFKETLYSVGFLNGIRLNMAVDDNGKSSKPSATILGRTFIVSLKNDFPLSSTAIFSRIPFKKSIEYNVSLNNSTFFDGTEI